MKTHLGWSLVLSALLVGASAQAGHNSYNSRSSHRPAYYGSRSCPPPVVNAACAPSYAWAPPATPSYSHAAVPACPPTGYWDWRQQRCWVPGRWVPQASSYTNSRRVWQSAHYETRWVQVWVPTRG